MRRFLSSVVIASSGLSFVCRNPVDWSVPRSARPSACLTLSRTPSIMLDRISRLARMRHGTVQELKPTISIQTQFIQQACTPDSRLAKHPRIPIENRINTSQQVLRIRRIDVSRQSTDQAGIDSASRCRSLVICVSVSVFIRDGKPVWRLTRVATPAQPEAT